MIKKELLSEMQLKGYLNSELRNPKTNAPLYGCVWYYWDAQYNQYKFEYDLECKDPDTEPIVQIVYDSSLINSNGWIKANLAVTVTGNGEVKYCISEGEC